MLSCYNLYSCHPETYPDILYVSDSILFSYVGQTVFINGDDTKKYTIGGTKQLIVADIENPYTLYEENLLPIEWTLTSLIYNGTELITGTPPTYTLTSSNIVYQICSGSICNPAAIPISTSNYSNQATFLNTIFANLSIPAKAYPFNIDNPPTYNNFPATAIGLPEDSTISFTIERTSGTLSGFEYTFSLNSLNEPIYELNGGEVGSYVLFTRDECLNNTLNIISVTPSFCNSTSVPVIITDTFEECVDCVVPQPPVGEACKIITRPGEPGFTTKNCDPEEVIKLKCTFSDSVYVLFKRMKYGIETCCEFNLDKADIKNMLIDLGELYDPDICDELVPYTMCCRQPCNVNVTINLPIILPCLAPTNPTVDINTPVPPCDDPTGPAVANLVLCTSIQLTIPGPRAVTTVSRFTTCDGILSGKTHAPGDSDLVYVLCVDYGQPIFTAGTVIVLGPC